MISKLLAAAIASLLLALPASASYLKTDQSTGQKMVCAESKWTLRYTDGSKSNTSLNPGECIVLTGSTTDGNYLTVRGVSGSRWLLNSNPTEIAQLGANNQPMFRTVKEPPLTEEQKIILYCAKRYQSAAQETMNCIKNLSSY
jgi:hypothetical protein